MTSLASIDMHLGTGSKAFCSILLAFALSGCVGQVEGTPAPGVDSPSGDSPAPDGYPDAGSGADAAAPGDRTPVDRTPDVPPSRGPLDVRVEDVGTSTITLGWDPTSGADGFDVYLAAEPSEGDTLPRALHVGSAPADASGITLHGIAAGTDAFLRVEARVSDGVLWGHVHARTEAGARAALETPLRRVHGYGPDVLMLVLANPALTYEGSHMAGDLGPAWQAGAWTIERHDGSTVGVRSVHRNSIPVSQPSYPVGFERWPDDSIVDVDHQIFLVLDEPLGASDVLRVRHSGGGADLDVLVPFSDRYLETPLIQVNQVGYNPRASRRWAYVSGWMGSGGGAELSALSSSAEVLIESLDPLSVRRAALTGLTVESRSETDEEAGGAVRQIDLAGLPPAEGVRYRVHIPGVGVSFPTAVSEEAALRAFYVVARGMYHNRWCGDLSAEHTEWSRPEDHCSAYFVTGRSYREGMFGADTPRTDARPLRGGHHDAGDFDIRPYHVVVAQYLLRAFEMDTSRFTDGQLTVPESGNGIPDLLDEALWSLAAWQGLQNPDGTIRAGVESHRHPSGIYKADADELPYWTYDPEPWHTAYVAALFAHAARLVRPFDEAKSTELEEAARAAYGSPIASGAPDGPRLYAAGELAALTGEAAYGDDFVALWRSLDRYGGGAFDSLTPMQHVYPGYFGTDQAMADFVMGYAQSSGADSAIVAVIRGELVDRADAVAATVLDSAHAHRNGRAGSDPPDWGHTSSTGRHVDLIYQALQFGGLTEEARQRYFDALSVSADYALGANPWGRTYLTGLGTDSPNEPLHNDSLAFLKEGMPPVPGIPIYGPIRSIPGASYYDPVEAALYPRFDMRPPGRRVIDSRTAVVSSEFTIWENQAPFTELFGALLGAGMEPPSTWLPDGAAHRSPLPEHFAE